MRWAAAYLDEHREILGCAISASSVHRILTAHGLRPHRRKYFLHITDPQFFPKMEALLRLYADPPPTLFCFYECTGLQALDDGKDYLSTIIGGDEKVQQARPTLIEELGARLGMVPRSS